MAVATVGVRTVAELVYGFVNADGGWDEEEEDGVEGEERGRMEDGGGGGGEGW